MTRPPTVPGPATIAPAHLVDRVRDRLVSVAADATPVSVAAALRREGLILGDDAVRAMVTALRSELAGAGPLESWLGLPDVTDVLVNGPAETWIDRGAGLQRAEVTFRDEASVRRLAQRLAASAGRRLDDASPYVDARLQDGTRLHAVLPPVAAAGTLISLRIPRRRAFTLTDLVAAGAVPAAAAPWLQALVATRAAYLVTGGTGTGKTTVLSTLLGLVGPSERVLIVEDSAELVPEHPHVVRLESRPANLEGVGAVTLRDLVRQALRMRPDRLVVGEVRGPEVVDLLAALNTGHEGGCGTVHANSARDAPARLEALALAAGLGRDALHAQLAAGVDVVLHLTRNRTGHRAMEGLHVLVRGPDGLVSCLPALGFTPAGLVAGEGLARLRERLGDHLPADAELGSPQRGSS